MGQYFKVAGRLRATCGPRGPAVALRQGTGFAVLLRDPRRRRGQGSQSRGAESRRSLRWPALRRRLPNPSRSASPSVLAPPPSTRRPAARRGLSRWAKTRASSMYEVTSSMNQRCSQAWLESDLRQSPGEDRLRSACQQDPRPAGSSGCRPVLGTPGRDFAVPSAEFCRSRRAD